MPRNRGGWRDAIAQQMLQQQQLGGGMPPPMTGATAPTGIGGFGMPPADAPQMPMGGGKPMPPGAGMGSIGTAPQSTGMTGGMPNPYMPSAANWQTATGGPPPAAAPPPYAGVGSLSSGPGGMNMSSLNAPYQAPVMPQTTGGPPLFPTGGS